MDLPRYARPKLLMLHLTDQCPLRCEYCWIHHKPRRMTLETAHRTVDWFFSRNVSGIERDLAINFFGGEPFLELDTMAAVVTHARKLAHAAHKKITFAATTSGVVATPQAERIIQDAEMELLISLDGSPVTNRPRKLVNGHDSYPIVVRNLPQLLRWSHQSMVRATYHPEALDLAGTVRHLLGLGAPAIALCAVEEASWQGHEEALETAYQALAEVYISEARQGQILPLELTHRLLVRRHRNGGQRPDRPCGVGTQLIAVDPEGNVMPCHRFTSRPQDWLGTVRDNYLSPERMRFVHLASRNLLGCDDCTARPLCGGGCRAVVANAGIDLATGVHPNYCMTMRAHTRAVERIYDVLTQEQNPHFLNALRSPRPWSSGLMELSR